MNGDLKRKTMEQLLIAISISIFSYFIIDPYFFDPYIRKMVFGDTGERLITSVSQWIFSFSIAFWYYRENPILNSYLVSGFLPVFGIVIYEFTLLHLYIDFIHFTPLFAIFYIFLKKRYTLRYKYIIISTTILLLWAVLLKVFSLNYTKINLNVGGVATIVWLLVNTGICYAIRKR